MQKVTAAERRRALDLLVVAIAKYRHMQRELEPNKEHPQVRNAYYRVQAIADAFQVALDAMNGDMVMLRIYAD